MQVNNYGNSPVYNNQQTGQSQPVTYNPNVPSSYSTTDQYQSTQSTSGGGLFGGAQKRQLVTRQDVLLGAAGAGVGFLIGGPIGAVIGGVIGLLIGVLGKLFSNSSANKQATNMTTPVNQQVQQNFNAAYTPNSNQTSQSDAYYKQLQMEQSLQNNQK